MFFGPLKYIKRRHFFLQYGSVGPIFLHKIIQSWHKSEIFIVHTIAASFCNYFITKKFAEQIIPEFFPILDCLNILHSYLSNSFLLGFHEFYVSKADFNIERVYLRSLNLWLAPAQMRKPYFKEKHFVWSNPCTK